MKRNVYEFRWAVTGDKMLRGVANDGTRRILATHFDDAYKLFLAYIVKYWGREADVEVYSATLVMTNVEV